MAQKKAQKKAPQLNIDPKDLDLGDDVIVYQNSVEKELDDAFTALFGDAD